MEANKIIMYKDKPCIKAKVIMLPTERSNMCKLIDLEDNSFEIKLQPNKDAFKDDKSHGFHIQPFELYIITDKKIKEGDYGYDINRNIIFKCDEIIIYKHFDKENTIDKIDILDDTLKKSFNIKNCRKIIATTDLLLGKPFSKDGMLQSQRLPQPSQAFIEAYCKAGGIDKVLVEVDVLGYTKGNTWISVAGGSGRVEVPNTAEDRRTYSIKTDSHNTISIHPIEEKMYSKEDLIGNSINSLDTFLLNSNKYTQEEREVIMEGIFDWVEKENLK